MKRTLISSLLLLMFTNVCSAETLWQNAQPRMTVAQVQNVYASAHRVEPPDRPTGGAIELLRIDNVKVADHNFFVSFAFKEKGLTKVALTLKSEDSAIEVKNVFHSLLNALRSKYGKEISLTDKTRRSFEDMRASWLSGNTNIDLRYVRISQVSPILSITYTSNPAESTQNL